MDTDRHLRIPAARMEELPAVLLEGDGDSSSGLREKEPAEFGEELVELLR